MTDMAECLVALYKTWGYNEGETPHVFVLRFNPDERDSHLPVVDLDERLRVVATRVKQLRASDLGAYPRGIPNVEYYFYHSKCQRHIDFAASKPDAIRVGAVVP